MATKGAYGITRTEYRSGDMVCRECYRSWREDITPSGRCPWEYQHSTDQAGHIAHRRRKVILGDTLARR